MGLTAYKKKRSFDKTPEPSGKKHKGSATLRFVIQKHHASRLHYDFRLEMEGVLKSWAVPKGPSLNPRDKRLAMMVEDHPYEYRTFEGIIPEGNYGAGTVIIWDEGTYTALEKKPGQSDEEALLEQLDSGNIKLDMKGKKIKGGFALVKSKSADEDNAWLLIKKKDKYVSEEDITLKDKSVVSGKTLEKVASTSNNEWISNRSSKTASKKKVKKPVSTKDPETPPSTGNTTPLSKKEILQLLKGATKGTMPTSVKPMLASLTDHAFDNPDWIFELKWDGYRAIAEINKGKVSLYSRNLITFNAKFKPIVSELETLPYNMVLDGEIVALNEEGKVDFQQLQAWQKTGEGHLQMYIFDILWMEGYDLTGLPLIKRKEILKNILPDHPVIRYSDHIIGSGNDFFELAEKEGVEGIMAKDKNSTYISSKRTSSWLKVKTNKRQEAIICGYTKGRGGRKYFGSLVLGIYEKGKLRYIGQTGSGFNDKTLADLHAQLKKIETAKSPFEVKPKTTMPVTWVKPELLCEVKFQEWTREGSMRHPIFMGTREDKKPKEITREKEIPVEEIVGSEHSSATKNEVADNGIGKEKNSVKKATSKKPAKAGKKIKIPEKGRFDTTLKKQDLRIDGKTITFTNPGKIYWKKEKITKGDMLNYYDRVSSYILPYMKDRPQSLNRHPDGVGGKSFYQKNVKGKVPDWVETYEYTSESDGEKKEFFVCTDEASLLYIANLGCIELNPWHSRIASADYPDWCVIDLDPGNISFEKVIEAALVVKEVLDALGVPSYPKTSGSTGIHIYIPLGAQYTYDQSRQLAELVVTLVHDRIPAFTSLERSPARRKTKIYLDYLQNRAIQTIAAPYSLRPKPGATVSTPLYWEEVKRGLKIADFTIFNITDRLKETGDIFTPVLGKGIDLEKTLLKAGDYLGGSGKI